MENIKITYTEKGFYAGDVRKSIIIKYTPFLYEKTLKKIKVSNEHLIKLP